MIDYIVNNKDWLFSGIGVVIIVAIVSFIWRKISGKSSNHQPVIVHVTSENISNNSDPEPEVPIERISPIAFSDIEKTIENAPPLQHDDIKKNFEGIKVEWDAQLKSASKDEEGVISLRLRPDGGSYLDTIKCKVSYDDYKELGVLPKGAKIRVYGEITDADSFDVTLKEVALYFIDTNEHT